MTFKVNHLNLPCPLPPLPLVVDFAWKTLKAETFAFNCERVDNAAFKRIYYTNYKCY